MSYVLHIWPQPADKPVPRSVPELDKLVTQLTESKLPQPDPRFVELAQRLTSRYPCLTEAPEDSVWSDGPLDGRTSQGAYALGVQTAYLPEVVPFVVETARALGLNVFDMQAAEGHLADGTVLHRPGRAPMDWAAEAERQRDGLETAEQAMRLMAEAIKPFMEKAGFKYVKKSNEFVRKMGTIKHSLFIGAERHEPAPLGWRFAYWVAYSFQITEELDIFNQMLASDPQGQSYLHDGLVFYCNWAIINKDLAIPMRLDKRSEVFFLIDRRSAAPGVCEEIENYLDKRVFPLVDQCDSLKALFDHFNLIDHQEIKLRHAGIHARAPLFLAYLFDKDRFEQHIRAALKVSDRYGHPALPKEIMNVVAGLPDGERWVQVVERAS